MAPPAESAQGATPAHHRPRLGTAELDRLLAGRQLADVNGVLWRFEPQERRELRIVSGDYDEHQASLLVELVTWDLNTHQRWAGRFIARLTWVGDRWALESANNISFQRAAAGG